jgi:mannose-6-phosphate isomerase-like protein (cupin superfamily)
MTAEFMVRAGETRETRVPVSQDFKAMGDDTGGAYALCEFELRGAPPHIHRHEDEGLYVLEGAIEVTVGGTKLLASKGDFVFMPKNVPHSIVLVEEPARVLSLSTPSGFEHLCEDLAEARMPGHDHSPEAMAAIQARYGWVPVKE